MRDELGGSIIIVVDVNVNENVNIQENTWLPSLWSQKSRLSADSNITLLSVL